MATRLDWMERVLSAARVVLADHELASTESMVALESAVEKHDAEAKREKLREKLIAAFHEEGAAMRAVMRGGVGR